MTRSEWKAAARARLGGGIFKDQWLMGVVFCLVVSAIVGAAGSILPGVGALEEARAAKVIGKSLEADVHLTVPEGDVFLADENPAALADLFIVSKVELTVGGELAVKVENAAGTKCPRCWKHSLTPNAEGLCPRCAEVVRHLPDLL